MIKGVLFDVDDTLYSHKTHEVPKLTLKLLTRLKEKGIRIGICTSRMIMEMASFPDILNDYIDVKIMNTGSVTQVSNKYFKSYTIDSKDARRYVDYFNEHHLSYCYCDISGNLYYWGDLSLVENGKLLRMCNGNVLFKAWDEEDEIANIFYYFGDNKDEEAIKAINPHAYISKWGNSANICATYIDKSFGVLKFCEVMGFTTDEVVACGDGGNDGDMLEMAGIGIAVKDATERTKKMADAVCEKSIEEGGLYEKFMDLGILEKETYTSEAFFFDCDSTLFDHSNDSVSLKTIYSLKKLIEKGHKLIMNTSRTFKELKNVDESVLELFDVISCSGGAWIKYKDHIETSSFDEERLRKVMKVLNRNNITYRLGTLDGGGFLNHNDREKEEFFYKLYAMVPPVKKYEGEEVCHLLFYSDEEIRKEVQSILVDENLVFLKIATEVSPSGTDKASALRKICDEMNIDIRNSVAFGDSSNDLTMIEMAGLGIAMGNGSMELKRHADYITDSIGEEGIYNALVHFGFIGKMKE